MTRTQQLFLIVLVAISAAAVWWVTHSSSGLDQLHTFRAELQQRQQQNARAMRKNQQLRRRVMALRYDHRAIEREARELLSWNRDGEVTIIFPR